MNITVNKSAPESVYLQIKDRLKEYIRDNSLKEGDRLPDLKSIASSAGVSLRTAYLGAEALIKEGVCYKRPKNGIFVKSSREKQYLRNICGIYDKRLLESYSHGNDLVQQSIFKAISGNVDKYQTETFFITNDPEGTIDFYSEIKEFNLNGILMLYWDSLEAGIRLAERFPQLKFIYLNYFIKDFEQTPENIYGVFNDDFGGAYQMCLNTLDKGCGNTKIFTLDLPGENYKRRVKGFLAALKDNGFKIGSDTLMTAGVRGKRSLQETGRMLSSELFSSGSEVDSILCVNDLIAEGASDWLRENDVADVRVSGYDNILGHISADKNFSTVSIDFEKMGIKALDIISGKAENCPKIINIPPQIIERNQGKK